MNCKSSVYRIADFFRLPAEKNFSADFSASAEKSAEAVLKSNIKQASKQASKNHANSLIFSDFFYFFYRFLTAKSQKILRFFIFRKLPFSAPKPHPISCPARK